MPWLTDRRTNGCWTILGNNTSAELKLKAELKIPFMHSGVIVLIRFIQTDEQMDGCLWSLKLSRGIKHHIMWWDLQPDKISKSKKQQWKGKETLYVKHIWVKMCKSHLTLSWLWWHPSQMCRNVIWTCCMEASCGHQLSRILSPQPAAHYTHNSAAWPAIAR